MENIAPPDWEYGYSLGIVVPSLIVAPTSNISQPTSVVWRSPLNTETEVLKAVPLFLQVNVQPEKAAANIEILGLVSATEISPGGAITYSLVLKNLEEVAIDNIRIVGTMSPGFQVDSLDFGEKFILDSDSNDEVIIFSEGTLEAREEALFRITGRVPQGVTGNIENIVTVEKSINSPITITTNIDPALGPDLNILGFVEPDPASVGGPIVYTLEAKNDGRAIATNIEVRNSLPSEVNLIAAITGGDFVTTGTADTNNVVTFSGGTLHPTHSATLTIIGRISRTATAGRISNVVAIDPGNRITEKNESNNIAIINTQINSAPVLYLSENEIDYSATFTRGKGAVVIVDRTNLTISDDTDRLASATITITNLLDGANEVLMVDTSGTGISSIYDVTTGVLALSGNDTVANYQQVLRTTRYDNTFVAPSTAPRTIEFLVNDGNINSAVATTTLNIMSATPIDLGTISGPTFSPIANLSDIHCDNIYNLTLAGTSRLVVELVVREGNADLELYDSSGSLLDSSTNSGITSERIYQDYLIAGDYIVRVFQPDPSASVNYLLRLISQTIEDHG